MWCIRRRAFGTLLLAAGASVLRPPEARAAQASIADFVGSFGFSGGARERKARDDAIEDVVSDMNILIRSIARDRLKSSNRIAEKLRIARSGKRLTITLDGRSYSAPINGGSVEVVGVTGDKLRMRHRFADGRIEQRFDGDSGGRVNIYSLHDGNVKMAVRVFSERLPKDLRYTLSYQRKK